MNPFHRLTPENKEHVVKYLKFFRAKKDSILRSLGNEFEDSKADRITDNMFSREDMEEYTDFLQSQCHSQIAQDIGVLINMSALAINSMLESAQDQGASVELDTTALENQGLLDSIERMSMDVVPSGRRPTSLVSLKDEAKAMKDESKAVRDEASRLAESNKILQQRFTAVQTDASSLAREKRDLQQEVDMLRRQLETVERSAQQRERSGKDNNDDSIREIRRLEDELSEEKQNNTARVSDTPQFIQMKKMMQSQNQKIKDLRRRLSRYEPDDTKEDDDERY